MAGINDYPNTLTSGAWAADFIAPEHLVPGGGRLDVAQFFAQDSVLVRATATANSSATSITVAALSGPIPAGTLLDFGGAGAKLAKTTATAAAGATSIAVVALAAAVSAGDTARYFGDGTKKKVVPSGSLVGRTEAERLAGTLFGPATETDDEFYIVPFEIHDLARNPDVELLKPNNAFAVNENFLPDWTTLNTAANEVQTVVIGGTLSAGTFTFFDPKTNKSSSPLAYNGNLAAIQAALDTVYGASNTVAAGTIASFTITFAAALAGVAQEAIRVIPSGVTGLTGVTVTRTTKGGKPLLEKLRACFRCITGVA